MCRVYNQYSNTLLYFFEKSSSFFERNLLGYMLMIYIIVGCESNPSSDRLPPFEIYLLGHDRLEVYEDSLDKKDLARAKHYFLQAIEGDPELALAYLGLGWVYFNTYYWWSEEFLKKDYLDSVLILADLALTLDPGLAEAWHLRGKYYGHTGNPDRAIDDLNRAIEMDPQDAAAFLSMGWVYCQLNQDYLTGFANFGKARESGDVNKWPPQYHNDIAYGYMNIGDYDQALSHLHRAIRLQPDIMEPILLSSWLLEVQGRIDEKLVFIDSIQQLFPGSNACISELAYTYAGLGDFEKAEKYYAQVIDTLNKEERIPLKFAHRLGYVFWNLGQKTRAMEYFNHQVSYCLESLSSGGGYQTVEYDLAAVHAFLGEEEKALEYLNRYASKGFTYGLHDYILRDPLFEKLWVIEEFKALIQRVQDEKAVLRRKIRDMKGAELE
jgi:tetratricopeptide (TPR) repeat protein